MQRLLRPEEVALCEFIQIMGAGGYPPSVKVVKKMAEEMAYYRNKVPKYLERVHIPSFGKNWMEGFKMRNAGMKTMYTRARDVKRTEGTRPERVQPFYLALKELRRRHRHPALVTFNMDKTGFAIGNVQRRKGVIYRNPVSATTGGKRVHALQAKQSGRELITSIK
jgi:hypothetical protein